MDNRPKWVSSAVTLLELALEGQIELDMDQLEWCEGIVFELLEVCNDELKPKAEAIARARKD